MENKNIEQKVSEMLLELGVPANLKGFRYLKTAILMCFDDETKIEHITKSIYPDIANIYHTTPSRVERGMRHSLENMIERGNLDYIYRFFGNSISRNTGKPTNSQFIATCAEHLITGNIDKISKESA